MWLLMKSLCAPGQSASLQVGRTRMEGAEPGLPPRWGQYILHLSGCAWQRRLPGGVQWRGQDLVGTAIIIALAFAGGSVHGGHWPLGPEAHNQPSWELLKDPRRF